MGSFEVPTEQNGCKIKMTGWEKILACSQDVKTFLKSHYNFYDFTRKFPMSDYFWEFGTPPNPILSNFWCPILTVTPDRKPVNLTSVHTGQRCILIQTDSTYRKVASSNTSHLKAHDDFFRLIMKEIFDLFVLWPFDIKLIS